MAIKESKMRYLILLVLLSVGLFAGSKPTYDQIFNSYGYSGVRVRDDSLDIDTTGSGAWKSVLNDTSNAIETRVYQSTVFSYTLALAQSDSASFKINIGCYDDGLNVWMWGDDYLESQYYGAGSMVSTYTLDTNTTGYGRRMFEIKQCDMIKLVFSAPAEMSNTDTATVGARYIRGKE